MSNAKYLLEFVNDQIISPVYLVGGSVRDLLRGMEPSDFDFTTPHTVDVVEKAIQASGRKAYSVGNGKRHGTMCFKINGQEIQITTFRTERYEEGSRQPITTYTDSLEEDLSRRDFTMNAIAMDRNGLIDPFNGAADIEDRWIRAVGDPCERFQEDPLRILRTVRFQSTLNFLTHPSLDAAVESQRSRLLTISKERWVMELDKLLMGENVDKALSEMKIFKLFSIMIPELNFRHKTFDPWFGRQLPTLNQRWSVLIGDNLQLPYAVAFGADKKHKALYRQDMIRKIAHHLKFSKERTNFILSSWGP